MAHGHGPSTHQIIKNTEQWEKEFGIQLFHLWGSENDEWNGIRGVITEQCLKLRL